MENKTTQTILAEGNSVCLRMICPNYSMILWYVKSWQTNERSWQQLSLWDAHTGHRRDTQQHIKVCVCIHFSVSKSIAWLTNGPRVTALRLTLCSTIPFHISSTSLLQVRSHWSNWQHLFSSITAWMRQLETKKKLCVSAGARICFTEWRKSICKLGYMGHIKGQAKENIITKRSRLTISRRSSIFFKSHNTSLPGFFSKLWPYIFLSWCDISA